MGISGKDYQTLHDNCRILGYDFDLALKTLLRDGKPWFVPIGTVR